MLGDLYIVAARTDPEAKGSRGISLFIVPKKLVNERGELTGLLGINRDITERKQTELALAASETRYRTLFQTAPEAVLIADGQGLIADVRAQIW